MLTGELPFHGTPRMLQHKVINEEPPSPRRLDAAVPRDLETICLRCMQKDPHRRYATAQQVAEDLRRFVDGKPILRRPVGSVERAWRWCKRNPSMATTGLSLTLVLVLLAVAGPLVAIYQSSLRKEADTARQNETVLRLAAEGLADQNKRLAEREANHSGPNANRERLGNRLEGRSAELSPILC